MVLLALSLSCAHADRPASPHRLDLSFPPLSAQETSRQQRLVAGHGQFLIGFGRAMPTSGEETRVDAVPCQVLPSGLASCALRVRSPGAVGLRLGVRVDRLPVQATLRFISPDGTPRAVVSGVDVNASLAADQVAGASGLLYWSPVFVGEALVLEIELPVGVDPEQVQVSVPQVSHLFRLPWLQTEIHTETDCYRDVSCDKGAERISRATALILFTDADGETGTCTGSLLADVDPATDIPYLLTAHHCVADQPKASSIESLWRYRARECDGPAETHLWVRGGADLMATVRSADSSLLRLRQPSPEGSAFARWSTALPLEGEPVLSIHHPHGKPQKLTKGRLKDYLHCEDAAYCGEDADPDGIHYLSVAWTAGVTKSGSSGAGLFLVSTGELIGVLSGGLSSCDTPEGADDYGWLGYWGHSSIIGGLDQQR